MVEPNLCTDERLEKEALEQHEEAKAKVRQHREHEALVEAKRLEAISMRVKVNKKNLEALTRYGLREQYRARELVIPKWGKRADFIEELSQHDKKDKSKNKKLTSVEDLPGEHRFHAKRERERE